jgi:hypothetical protein
VAFGVVLLLLLAVLIWMEGEPGRDEAAARDRLEQTAAEAQHALGKAAVDGKLSQAEAQRVVYGTEILDFHANAAGWQLLVRSYGVEYGPFGDSNLYGCYRIRIQDPPAADRRKVPCRDKSDQ